MGSGHVRYAHLMEIVALFSILHAQLNPSCQFQLTKYDELKIPAVSPNSPNTTS